MPVLVGNRDCGKEDSGRLGGIWFGVFNKQTTWEKENGRCVPFLLRNKFQRARKLQRNAVQAGVWGLVGWWDVIKGELIAEPFPCKEDCRDN